MQVYLLHSRYIAVYNLDEANLTGIGLKIEGLGFDARGCGGLPFLILLGELGEGCGFGLFGDGVDSFSAIFGFLGSSDRGQTTTAIISI